MEEVFGAGSNPFANAVTRTMRDPFVPHNRLHLNFGESTAQYIFADRRAMNRIPTRSFTSE